MYRFTSRQVYYTKEGPFSRIVVKAGMSLFSDMTRKYCEKFLVAFIVGDETASLHICAHALERKTVPAKPYAIQCEMTIGFKSNRLSSSCILYLTL